MILSGTKAPLANRFPWTKDPRVLVPVLAALLLGSHPLFVSTLGWNYVDGFGITYFLLAQAFASAAPWARRPALTAAATGAALTALVSANLYYALLAPFVLAELVLQRRRAGGSLLRDLGWAGVGALGTFLAMGSVSAAWGGHFFYLEPSLVFARGYLHLEENPWVKQGLSWLRWAHWLIVPLAVAIGS